ncbi:MAG: ATP-binding cassette domain-containing protein [Lachnospiraceae bacterium]
MIKKRLLELMGSSKKYVGLQIFWQWISLLAQVGIVTCIAGLVQGAYDHTLTQELILRFFVLAGVLVLVRYLCDRCYGRAGYLASVDVKRVLRGKIYEKLLRLGPSYREKIPPAEVMQMTTEGVEQLETYYGKYLSQFFYAMLAPLTLFFVLLPVSPVSAGILLVFVPLIPIVIMVVMKVARKLLDGYFRIYYGLADTFLEKLRGLTVLKVYGADEKAAQDMARESENFRLVTMKVLGMQLCSTVVMDIAAYGGTAAGLVTALLAFSRGDVNLYGMILILFLGAEFFLPMRLLGSYFHIGMNGMKASDRIFAFLDLPEEAPGKEKIPEGKTDIEVRNLTFSYDGSRDALRDVSFSFPRGSFTAIVGASGSGKSTLAGILTLQNRYHQGSVTVGGIDLSDIRQESLFSHLTLVANESPVFSGTIRENLLLGNPAAKDRDLLQALSTVRLSEFATEGGLDREVEEHGANLSGGQRQRLVLARALLHDSDLYLLDEATSNIDAASEEAIMDAVKALRGKKTIILITHRLANAVEADRIYCMENGQVTESGTHEALLAKRGPYAALYREQKSLEDYTKEHEGKDISRTVLTQPKTREESGASEEAAAPAARRSGFAIMRRLIVLVKPLTPVMLCGITLGVLGFLCAIFVTVLAAEGAGRILTGALPGRLLILIPVLAILRGVLHYGEQYANHYIAFRILALIRQKVFAALRALAPAKLEGKNQGNLVSILTSDIELLEVFYAHTISPIAIAVVTDLVLCILLGIQYLPAALVAAAAYVAVGAILPIWNGKRGKNAGMAFRTSFGSMNSALLEGIGGVFETIQFGGSQKAARDMDERAGKLAAIQKDLTRYESAERAIANLLIQCFSFLMLGVMLHAFLAGTVGIGALLFAVSLMMSSFGPSAALASVSNSLNQTLASGERVLSLLEEEPVTRENERGEEPEDAGASLSHVTFSYGGAPVLRDLTAVIPKGKILGIQGPSGCGKSTVLKLLMRFYDPEEGVVQVGGHDAAKIQTASLRRLESYVTQDTILFSATAADNISLGIPAGGDTKVNREKIIEAAKMANIDGLIRSLPQGYDTKLGGTDALLSAGEKQRIGIARALYHGGDLLLMDEPTSSLDALNEGLVMKTVRESAKDRTIVLVSHRRAALSIADAILEIREEDA